MVELDYERLDALAEERREAFATAEPYPFTVIDDFLPAEDAEQTLAEFEATESGWNHYHHYNEKKLALTDICQMGTHTQRVFAALQHQRFVEFLERLTGIDSLIADPDLDGAGLHQIVRGGFLNVHADFQSHTVNSAWSRQINLLIYFNRDWKPEWQGNLELWATDVSRCVESVEPVELDELDDADADRDGFASAEALRQEIAAIYGEALRDGGGLYRVRFAVLPPEEQQRLKNKKMATS